MAERLTHWEGEPVAVWESVWGVPGVEAWDTLGSTNDRARELARNGAPAFSVVLAEEQTAGRGREGRRWWSPPGAGLWMSLLLRPWAGRADTPAPLLVGLAVCRAVEAVVPGTRAEIEWPNDVLLAGRKVCGILCEGSGGTVVAGVGVNVRQAPDDFPAEIRDRATSLERASGGRVARSALAGRIVAETRRLLDGPSLRLDGAAGREIRSRDALRDRAVTVAGGPDGVARGIGPDGALLVEDDDGTVRKVVAGTVRTVTPVTGRRDAPDAGRDAGAHPAG